MIVFLKVSIISVGNFLMVLTLQETEQTHRNKMISDEYLFHYKFNIHKCLFSDIFPTKEIHFLTYNSCINGKVIPFSF